MAGAARRSPVWSTWIAGLLALAGLLGPATTGAVENEPPQQQPPPAPLEPPLPPALAPDLFLVEQFTHQSLVPRGPTSGLPRRASGFIPFNCQELVQDPSGSFLDCWLQHHPLIAHAIDWPTAPDRVLRWPFWTLAEKEELWQAFQAARAWGAGGFAAWPGDLWEEPPANQEAVHLDESEIRTVLDTGTQARREFLAQVGVSLAAEIEGWVPWSLRDYDPAALREVFSASTQRYSPDTDDGGPGDSVYPGHLVQGLTPAHPATILRFLIAEGLVDETPRATIGRLLEWSRDHLRHQFTVGLPVGREWFAFWQYRGLPPVARIIDGTLASDPELGVLFPGVRSWTSGCTGTTRFLRAILRVVNIPVREIVEPRTCGHAQPYFAGEGLYLSHADDPYTTLFKTGEYRGEDLLVPAVTWHRWFPLGDEAAACRSVGRRVVDLNVIRPSAELVRVHCLDRLAGAAPEDSEVFRVHIRDLYTIDELLTLDFWTRLGALAESSTATECVAWRASR